ncbi:hypothetical protein BDP27DRAFT_1436106 [Rhodocollybia butyracea]|uniref:F-box domain-containing protein n=1 Tax=Rhodocollybia butyracea TaxID=206335 RepID=A0A9P5P4U6_9AGAR|nr:hypothetical protein BDP27DRAFT_1436106 [Rhodocollybia butyracea]
MMPSSFLELPDEFLFNVVKFLQVPDILAARKTCKRLQAITMSRNLWTTMYQMSRSNNGFVPPVASNFCGMFTGWTHFGKLVPPLIGWSNKSGMIRLPWRVASEGMSTYIKVVILLPKLFSRALFMSKPRSFPT